MSRTRRVQILKNGEWEYVFCILQNTARAGEIITTKNRDKAIKYFHLEHFQKTFGNDQFRVY